MTNAPGCASDCDDTRWQDTGELASQDTGEFALKFDEKTQESSLDKTQESSLDKTQESSLDKTQESSHWHSVLNLWPPEPKLIATISQFLLKYLELSFCKCTIPCTLFTFTFGSLWIYQKPDCCNLFQVCHMSSRHSMENMPHLMHEIRD